MERKYQLLPWLKVPLGLFMLAFLSFPVQSWATQVLSCTGLGFQMGSLSRGACDLGSEMTWHCGPVPSPPVFAGHPRVCGMVLGHISESHHLFP